MQNGNDKSYDDLNIINLTDNAINAWFFSWISEIILYYSNYLFDNKVVEWKFTWFSPNNFTRISTDWRISSIHLTETDYHKIRNTLDPLIEGLKGNNSALALSNILYDTEKELKDIYEYLTVNHYSKIDKIYLFCSLFKVGFMNMYLNKYRNNDKEYENIKNYTMDRVKRLFISIVCLMNSLEKIKLQVRVGKYGDKFYSYSIHTISNKWYYQYNIHLSNEEDNKKFLLDIISKYYPKSYNKFINKLNDQWFNVHKKETEMEKYLKMLY